MTAVAPLPPGMLTFVDINGAPLVGGTIEHYEPGGLTTKDTYRNFAGTILNSNPLTLDARGQAAIWGRGRYRQILKDILGNTIWDKETFVAEALQAASVIMTWTGGPPSASQFLGGEYVDRAIDFAADFAGSGGLTPETEFTSDFVVTIKVSGVTIGTATRDVSEAAWVFATSGSTVKSAATDSEIKFYAPLVPDLTGADFGITLKGTLAE